MRSDEDTSMTKIRISVQSMIAQARKIVKPADRNAPSYNSSNSHIELHLPTARITEHLKEILHLCPDNYRKIDRHRRISLAKIEQSREELIDKSPFSQNKLEDTILLSRLTDRYQLKGIVNYQSELIDHKFHQHTKKSKRPLCKKKTINLEPIGHELPSVQRKSKSLIKVDEGLAEKIRSVGSKYFLSLTEEEIAKAREEREARLFKTVDQPQTKQLQRYVLCPNAKLKDEDDRIMRRKSRKPRVVAQLRASAKASVAGQLIEEQDYSPWQLQQGEGELIF